MTSNDKLVNYEVVDRIGHHHKFAIDQVKHLKLFKNLKIRILKPKYFEHIFMTLNNFK